MAGPFGRPMDSHPGGDRRRAVDASAGRTESLCFAGAKSDSDRAAPPRTCHAFAEKAMSCSRGAVPHWWVVPSWSCRCGAAGTGAWGLAREVRANASRCWPLPAPPLCAIDPAVRPVRMDELDVYLVAAVEMFIGEVGIDPRLGDGGRGYRRRVAGLIAAGRAWARFENGEVVFKAEIGSQTARVGQIQGVWVNPEWRGRGLGTTGTATLAAGRSYAVAVSPACTSTISMWQRGPPTSGSGSASWAPTQRFCSTDSVMCACLCAQLLTRKSRFDVGAPTGRGLITLLTSVPMATYTSPVSRSIVLVTIAAVEQAA